VPAPRRFNAIVPVHEPEQPGTNPAQPGTFDMLPPMAPPPAESSARSYAWVTQDSLPSIAMTSLDLPDFHTLPSSHSTLTPRDSDSDCLSSSLSLVSSEPPSGGVGGPGAPVVRTRSDGQRRSCGSVCEGANTEPQEQQEQQELLELLRERGVHVLQPSAQHLALPVPEAATAVVFLTELPPPPTACRLVQDLAARGLQQPFLVLLLRPRLPAGGARPLLGEAMHTLLELGADGVEEHPSSSLGLQELADAWLARAAAAFRTKLESRAREAQCQALKAEVQLAREREAGLFWEQAYTFLPEMPKLAADMAEPTPGGKCGSRHSIIEQVNCGSTSVVYLAQNSTGEMQALKAVPKRKLPNYSNVQALCKEIRMLKKLWHPNVVSYRGSAQTPGHMLLLLDFAGRRNLFRLLQAPHQHGLPAHCMRYLFRQAAHALKHCHMRGVSHRDVKPENFGVSDDGRTVKLLDFGMAAELNAPWLWTGTMPFLAPEVLARQSRAIIAAAADAWALGVVLLELLLGVDALPRMLGWRRPLPPQPACALELTAFLRRPLGLENALAAAQLPCTAPSDQPLGELLRGLLEVDVAARWSTATVVEAPWLGSEGQGTSRSAA